MTWPHGLPRASPRSSRTSPAGTVERRSAGWGMGECSTSRSQGPLSCRGLDMMESAPRAALPPMHIGIHTGPIIFQDGDVYGRTVNLASRIASHATAGQVLASEETMDRSQVEGVRFEPIGPVPLKGIASAVDLYRAVRDA
jgi:adenylate cyclase